MELGKVNNNFIHPTAIVEDSVILEQNNKCNTFIVK